MTPHATARPQAAAPHTGKTLLPISTERGAAHTLLGRGPSLYVLMIGTIVTHTYFNTKQMKQNYTSFLKEILFVLFWPMFYTFFVFVSYLPRWSGHDFTSDGIHYSINEDGKSVSVESCMWHYSGDVVIPSTVVHEDKTYRVTSIGYEAFYGCSFLTSIDLPESLTSIERNAFCLSGFTTFICRSEEVSVYQTFINLRNVPQYKATLYVPASVIKYCKEQNDWRQFSTILPLEDYETGTGAPSSSQDGGSVAAP